MPVRPRVPRDNSDRWDTRLNYAERHPILSLFWWGTGIVLALLAIAAVVGVATTGSIFFQSASSNLTVKPRVNIERNSTDNAVTSIEYFHNACGRVQTNIATYNNNKARADRFEKSAAQATDPIARQRATDLADQASTDATGALNQAVSAANDYNANTSNSLHAKFREQGLPDQINLPSDPSSLATFTVNCQ